jgi:hypothetical protein
MRVVMMAMMEMRQHTQLLQYGAPRTRSTDLTFESNAFFDEGNHNFGFAPAQLWQTAKIDLIF